MTNQSQYADPSGRYRLDSMIATGGMGVVWRGTDTRLHREVAIKVLKAEYAEDPLFRSRFEAEARSAGALHHPGIAGIYDYGAGDSADGRGQLSPYLVMELVEGQPLSALLANAKANDRTLDIAVVQDLMTQTAEALGVAHRAGIVHRDVKPANLLVTSDRRVKITDFGIARAADSVALTRTGSVMGTPQYLSPEQARGNPSTPASDVYSLGVVAFECLTGRRPFEADSPVATALAHLQQPVPALPATIPADLAAVVTRAMAKEPTQRFADGAAFAVALRNPSAAGAGADTPTPAEGSTQVLTGVVPPVPGPVPAGASGSGEPMRRLDTPTPYSGDDDEKKAGKSPWPAAIAVIALVIAAVVLIAWLTGGDDEDPTAQDTPSSSATTESSATEETSATEPTTEPTTEETSEAPATYDVDDSRYACLVDYEQAVADLRADGFQVNWQQDSSANDGSCRENTVSRFSDNGTLTEGTAITVFYWGPVEETEPTDDPTDETEPTDPLSDITEGIGG